MSEELPPRAWRLLLAEAFADAEDHGLGTWSPTFTATPGQNDRAADFIGERCDFLAHKLDDEPADDVSTETETQGPRLGRPRLRALVSELEAAWLARDETAWKATFVGLDTEDALDILEMAVIELAGHRKVVSLLASELAHKRSPDASDDQLRQSAQEIAEAAADKARSMSTEDDEP